MTSKWLLMSDPEHYSFSELLRDGKTTWDGVSNNLARKDLRNIRRGDAALIYHTGIERAVVGTAEVVSDRYSDPQQKNPKRVVVDIVPLEKLTRPVTPDAIRAAAKRSGSAQF